MAYRKRVYPFPRNPFYGNPVWKAKKSNTSVRGGPLVQRPVVVKGTYSVGNRARYSSMGAAPYHRRNTRTAGYLGIENKFFDTTYGSTAISNTVPSSEAETAAYGLICPQQSSAENGRDGRKIWLKSVQIHGRVFLDQASDQADVRVPLHIRFLIVLDKQTRGAQMDAEDCILTVAAPAADLAFNNVEHASRFKILASEDFVLTEGNTMTDGANTASLAGNMRSFTIFRKVNVPILFEASTGAVGDMTDNSVHVLCFANTTGGSLAYTSRCRYVG